MNQDTHNKEIDFTPEQQARIDMIYNAVKLALMVCLPEYPKAAEDMAIVANVADNLCDSLVSMGFEVAFPTRITEDDGSSYIEDSLAICKACGKETTEYGDGENVRYVINDGFVDRFVVCFDCHKDLMAHGEYTGCDSCGAYFTGDHLLPNPYDKDHAREVCPYCGGIWCD